MEKIKFFSPDDLSCGMNLQKSEVILNEYYQGTRKIENINDAIEIYNIKKFFDNKLYLTKWTPTDIENFEKIIANIFGTVARYVRSVDDKNLENTYQETVFYYKSDFWRLIDKFKTYQNISVDIIEKLLFSSKVRLNEILKSKNLTEY